MLVKAQRWASYAIAGVATAGAVSEQATADIIYSGTVNTRLNALELELQDGTRIARGVRDVLWDQHGGGAHSVARGTVLHGSANAGFAIDGFVGSRDAWWLLANLDTGYAVNLVTYFPSAAVVRGTFRTFGPSSSTVSGSFGHFGAGFAAMQFDVGQGSQYAWLRIHESTLVDWAYGTPGQPLLTGQTAVPESGSLGLLAAGAAGLLPWRAARRSRADGPPQTS